MMCQLRQKYIEMRIRSKYAFGKMFFLKDSQDLNNGHMSGVEAVNCLINPYFF